MITCHCKLFKQRCKQRGYKLEDVMPCVVKQDGKIWTIDTEHPAYPSRGLGDTIAKITKAIGIKPCKGCKKRQKWLNKVVPYKQ